MNKKIQIVLKKLEKQSKIEKLRLKQVERQDRMLAITKDTGQFFDTVLTVTKSTKILEVGTSTGYSTIWFADAAIRNNPNKAKIITIEKNPSKILRAKNNFKDAGIAKYVEIKQGNAINILEKMGTKKFDFVFLDADKENLKKYFDLVLPLVKVGGIIATDNMYYPKKYQKMMQEFSNYIQTKSNVQTVTTDIGNGEEFTVKISN